MARASGTLRAFGWSVCFFLWAALALRFKPHPATNHRRSLEPTKKGTRPKAHGGEAADLYQQSALEHPDKETYYLKKAANASHEAGDEISALHLYEQAQKLAPDDVGIAISIANIQKSRGNFRAALELLMDYAQRFPENEPLRALALRTISQHFQFQI